MSEKLYDIIEIHNLKDMLNKTKEMYKDKIAYKIRKKENEKEYINLTHGQVRDMIDNLGTALIDIGLKDKRIAVIGENRYEWKLHIWQLFAVQGL